MGAVAAISLLQIVSRYNLGTVNLLNVMVCLPLLALGADVEWPVNGGPGNIRYSPLT